MNKTHPERKSLLLLANSLPLTKSLVAAAHSRGVPTMWLTPHQIVEALSIKGQLRLGAEPIVKWTFDGISLTPASTRGVFNYIGSFPHHAFRNVAREDREYLLNELTSYLAFSLAYFPRVINPPRAGGVSGVTESLPFQWQYVKEIGLNIKVPWHEIILPRTSKRGFIETYDLFDYLNWNPRPPTRSVKAQKALLLRYKRPNGEPIVTWFVDDALLHFAPYGHALGSNSLSPSAFQIIERVTQNLRDRFALRMGQVLTFVRGQQVTFGCVAPFLSFTTAPLQVRHAVVDELLRALAC
jgi:hypothetical protein